MLAQVLDRARAIGGGQRIGECQIPAQDKQCLISVQCFAATPGLVHRHVCGSAAMALLSGLAGDPQRAGDVVPGDPLRSWGTQLPVAFVVRSAVAVRDGHRLLAVSAA